MQKLDMVTEIRLGFRLIRLGFRLGIRLIGLKKISEQFIVNPPRPSA